MFLFNPLNSILNLLGYILGTTLYALLLVTIAQGHRPINSPQYNKFAAKTSYDRLLLSAGILGVLWNSGNLIEILRRDFSGSEPSVFISVVSFAALGFLPAVIVHSELLNNGRQVFSLKILTVAAYSVSGLAAFTHLTNAISFSQSPSHFALRILTIGYIAILISLFWVRRTKFQYFKNNIAIVALAIFAVTAIHFSRHSSETQNIFLEIIGHQSSLPLIFVILFQDFRFVLADIFLKRAIGMIILFTFIGGLYGLVVAPLLLLHEQHPQPDMQRIGVLIGFALLSSFAYPPIKNFSNWLVARIFLRRVSYDRVLSDLNSEIFILETPQEVLELVNCKVAEILNLQKSEFSEISNVVPGIINKLPNISVSNAGFQLLIPTSGNPQYSLNFTNFSGGRRLLSDEIEMLETIAIQTARRIDNLRILHRQCEHELREQELSKLNTEAELRALRAQINPHFLFNALTTIGYLIQTSPDRAIRTLVHLTGLLRNSLRTLDDFHSLGEEIKLIEAYLEIEQARFEERLKVIIKVPEKLYSIRVPSLILQPLVENSVKHGISNKREGGTIQIEAQKKGNSFVLRVKDTGCGFNPDEVRLKRLSRVGLNNIERRLKLHYNNYAQLIIHGNKEQGTVAEIRIELKDMELTKSAQARALILPFFIGLTATVLPCL